jgi:hypothetical protein
LVNYDTNTVYTYISTTATYTNARTACISGNPVPGFQMNGSLWSINGYTEHQFVESYFRQNANLANHW